ncbi:rCG34736 [Rattus norvegicus]|uniref:RCG34736 n=1 Tax=Rattus norvegicus TaxID=10116 RepID=A6HI85_RAT|nr:rCG34736 [Rattus norvegicus]
MIVCVRLPGMRTSPALRVAKELTPGQAHANRWDSLHCLREGESQSPSLGEPSPPPPTTVKIFGTLLPASQAIWELLTSEADIM